MAETTAWQPWTGLAELRIDAGYTQHGLARQAGVSHTYVAQLEQGARQGRPGTLRRIAAVFGMTTSQLLATKPGTTNVYEDAA